ncbi:MAG: transglycosylase SLT domain-containing protein [Melioribacteraceae bacterium]|jgi:Rod binding domain-containing protein|nr:transglycosylase SLT domain-containing protein [Melioribacteraceae bacterium]
MNELNLKISNELKHQTKALESDSRFDSKRKEKVANAAKQFESMLTQMMIKSMNQASGGLFGSSEEGYGNDMFDTIFEEKISTYMSDTKSLGIAEMLYKKITGETMPSELRFKMTDRISPLPIKNDKPDTINNIKPSSSALERLNKYEDHIQEAAKQFGIDSTLIKSIIMTESAANSKAVSSAKAKGLMQLMDGTASDMGVRNSFNPQENINGGTKYFAQMLRQYGGDIKLALAAYNAGPGNVDKYNGVPPFDETKNYINKVLSYLDHFREKSL